MRLSLKTHKDLLKKLEPSIVRFLFKQTCRRRAAAKTLSCAVTKWKSVQTRRFGSVCERSLSLYNFHVICLTRGAGRYKYLNLMLVAYKNFTDRQI